MGIYCKHKVKQFTAKTKVNQQTCIGNNLDGRTGAELEMIMKIESTWGRGVTQDKNINRKHVAYRKQILEQTQDRM